MSENLLYCDDSLDTLRRYPKDQAVYLTQLDLPLTRILAHNVLFAEHKGAQLAARPKGGENTWRWDEDTGQGPGRHRREPAQ